MVLLEVLGLYSHQKYVQTMKIKRNNNELYIRPLKTELIDGIEYGRYFGQWKCLNCKRSWHSAYTWVSTDADINKFEDKKGKTWYSGKDLKDKEFLIEKCKSCDSSNNSNVAINRYSYLEYQINDTDNPYWKIFNSLKFI